jgi:CheY-like chemotaxis protein
MSLPERGRNGIMHYGVRPGKHGCLIRGPIILGKYAVAFRCGGCRRGRLGCRRPAGIPIPTSLRSRARDTLGYDTHQPQRGSPAILRILLIDGDPVRVASAAAGFLACACSVLGVLPGDADLGNQVRVARAAVIVSDVDNASHDAIESLRTLDRDEPRPVVMLVGHSSSDTTADEMAAGIAA